MLLWVLLSLLHVGLSNRLFLEQAVELSRPVRFNIYNGSVAQCQFSVEQWSHQLSLGMDGSMVDGVLISDLEGVSVNATGQVTCLLANTGLSQTFSVSVRFTASRIWHALLQTYNQCPQHCLCLQTLNMSMTDPLITVSLQPFSLHIGEFLREWLSQTIHSALQNAIAAGSLDFAISLDSSRSCSQLPPREKLMFAEPPPITTLSAALGFRQARDVAVDWSYHFQTPLGVAECAGDLFKPQHLATTQSVSIQFIVGSTDVNAGEFFLASLNVNKASCPECISSCCGTFSPIFSGELTGDFGFNVFLDANMSMWANISKSSSSPSIEFRGPSECGLNDGCSINGVGISWPLLCSEILNAATTHAFRNDFPDNGPYRLFTIESAALLPEAFALWIVVLIVAVVLLVASIALSCLCSRWFPKTCCCCCPNKCCWLRRKTTEEVWLLEGEQK